MIQFISGTPGAGKSQKAMKIIVTELRLSQRSIVTNVAVNMPGLCQYLHKNFDNTFDCVRRIRILNADQVIEFWKYPAPGVELTGTVEIIPERIIRRGGKSVKLEPETRLDFSGRFGDSGTLYVIDEVHEYFSARSWQSRGEDALHYFSHHRKLRDDVVLLTQNYANVDKQLRSVAQDFTHLRNLGMERFGLFRLPGKRVLTQVYLHPPTGNEKPMVTSIEKIDVEGLCQTYFTAAGAGIVGRDADVGLKKHGGLPFLWLIVAVVLGIAGIACIPHILGKGVSHAVLRSASTSVGLMTNSSVTVPAFPPQRKGANGEGMRPSNGESNNEPKGSQKKLVYLAGISRMGTNVTVYLTNGKKFTSGERELEQTGEDFVIILGHRVEFAPFSKGD